MLIDLGFKFKALDGKEGDETAAKVLANQLCMKTNLLPPVKAYDIALKLFNNNSVELDMTDVELLNKEILEFGLTNLAKAQIINYIKTIMLENSKN